MRQLTVHRERALACFAMKYHCILNRDRGEFLTGLAGRDRRELLGWESEHMLRNGETISIPIGEEAGSFFAAVCLEGKDLATEAAAYPAGCEDLRYVIRTDYDGYRRLRLTLAPAEQ